ncbi:uroporphyrinogen-III synthase [Promicromonospora vindobonensis]|uniref:Uroporphyrinogen-III synthase n=1 Tax=Promicromonospora vindobonensis TaxID=195748 RepID=A0ABW5VSM3_9MICO
MTEPGLRPAAPPGQAAVLVARAPERAAGLLALLREHGLDPVAAPVIERAAVEDRATLDAARARLADGAYEWVAITSVNAVEALFGATAAPTGREGETPGAEDVALGAHRLRSATHPVEHMVPPDHRSEHVRWAAVGPATQQALVGYGITVDLVPATATGAGLAEAFPAAPGGRDTAPRVLLPLGDLASDTLRAGLVAKGWAADVVTAYRTVTRELPAHLRRSYDVVVVTSGSVARQVAEQLGPQRVVTIGEPSARVAADVGHTVLAVADEPTDESLASAVTEALVRT